MDNLKYIIIPIIVIIISQLTKVTIFFIKTKKLDIVKFFDGTGGMPSSHSAVVCSLATLVGKNIGFSTPEFGIAFILAIIVMYDAAGVRRAAGKQAKLLNKIVATPGLSALQVQEKLVEVLGHTPLEVIVGAIIGVIVGIIM